ncbi:MAG: glycosyltransferase family 2 protein [Nitrososphaeria archaeon]
MTISQKKKLHSNEKEVSIIMPAYNVERQIKGAIKAIQGIMEEMNLNYEIIVIDDGSHDNTFKEASELSGRSVRVLKNKFNMGKGYSIKKGVFESSKDYVIMLDADMEISPSALKIYLSYLNKFDIVIGSKRQQGSIYRAPLTRKILSIGFNNIVRLLTGINQSDTQTGLKMFRSEHIKRIIKLVVTNRYAFDVEILVIAKLMNLKIGEIPVHIEQRGQFSAKEVMKMFLDLLGIVYRLRVIRWYQKKIYSQDFSKAVR